MSAEKSGPTTRLYGRVGAEVMYSDPASLYEEEIESSFDGAPPPGTRVEIEEWDVHPPQYHLPDGERLLEWLSEWAAENGEVVEGYDLDDVVKLPAIQAQAQFLLDYIASKVRYRMAKDHLRSLWVTWTEDGRPLLDGEPMDRPAAPDGGGTAGGTVDEC